MVKAAGPFRQEVEPEDLEARLFRLTQGVDTVLNQGFGIFPEIANQRETVKKALSETFEVIQDTMNLPGHGGLYVMVSFKKAAEESKTPFHPVILELIKESFRPARMFIGGGKEYI